jgi:hypothetical protein
MERVHVTHLMRRHGKIIMTVITAGLMLVFVVQTATTGRDSGSSGSVERGKLNGKKVLARDLNGAANDLSLLGNFVVQIPSMGERGMFPLLRFLVDPRIPMPRDEDERTVYWFLCQEEARKYGIAISEDEITQTVTALREQFGVDEENTNRQLTALSRTPGDLRTAIRHARMIARLAELAVTSTVVSLPQVEFDADRSLSQANISVAMVDGSKDWEKSPEPTPEQIQKQFALYKDVSPTVAPPPASSGTEPPAPPVLPPTIEGHEYPFGYKYPDRVKVEYLRFDRAEIAKQFQPTEEDYDAAFTYYRDHPDEFTEVRPEVTTQPIGPATKPAPPQVKPFSAVKEKLVQAQIDKRVSKKLNQVVDRARTLAADPWKIPDKQIPPEQWADYKAVAQEIGNNKEYGGFRPSYNTATGLLSAEQLEKLSGIGQAYFETPRGRVAFAKLATHVKELVGPKDPLANLFLEVGREGPLLKNSDGDLFLYRVVAQEKSREPASLEEVRGQVVEDLKKVAAYERAQGEAKKLASEAKSGDLALRAVAKGWDTEKVAGLSQTSKTAGKLGVVPGLVEAVFALTREAAPRSAKQSAATSPETQNGKRANGTTTLARDESFRVYVIEVMDYTPVSPALFAADRLQMVSESQNEERGRFVYAWLSPSALAERMHFVPAKPLKGEEKGEEE